jgi:hypothetical protein
MANRAGVVGTDAENRVRDYFRENGFPYADRLTKTGVNDRGDIRLGDGIPWTIEVKGGQGALNKPHSHLKELLAEMENNNHMYGAVIAKKPGSTKVGEDWVAMMPVSVLRKIIYYLGSRDATHPDDVGD